MLRRGIPIHEVQLKDSVDAQITFSMGYAEWDACLAAGLNLWTWESGDYPMWFKKRVMAFVGLYRLIEAHVEDARAAYMEKESKKARRK